MKNLNSKELLEYSKNADAILYFVGSKNIELNEEAVDEIAEKISLILDYESYITSHGRNVQDPIMLSDEIKMLKMKNIEIVYYNFETLIATLLSKKQLKKFLKDLEIKKEKVLHTGIIVQSYIKESEGKRIEFF